MTETRKCPQCGSAFPSDGPAGVCPRCMLGLGFGETTESGGAASAPFMAPSPGELQAAFPQLEVLELIGQGGMGAVYQARQRGLDRIVALKILATPPDNHAMFEQRFVREAKALARLSHPNIVTIYDSGRVGDYFYLLMEFVDGVNLRHAIQTRSLSPKEALAIVPQICEALQYAHDEGVVHRDIKPENVLIDRKGRVKVADFGLAKLLGRSGDSFTLTGTHQVMGTPRYMAPEQLEGSHHVDHRADIYSLGVVFYELLTGELPLGRFAPPSKKAQIDVRLDDVVLRTLAKEPDARYQQASEIKTAVERIFANRVLHGRPFHEYRSTTTVFGLPLVHIARGVDPITGRKVIAKGIVAIGDIAIGGLALGGVAIGGITLGGVSIGLMTFGGVSVGLILALGGLALGCGLSIGGLAVGSIACGGGAIGYYAYGGGAFGVHGYGGNIRDAQALDALQNPAHLFRHAFSTLTWCVAPILLCIMTLLLVLVGRRQPVPEPSRTPAKPPVFQPRASGSSVAWVFLGLLGGVMFLACAGFAMLLVIPIFGHRQVVSGPGPAWEFRERGPELGAQAVSSLQLHRRQLAQFNQIVQAVSQKQAEMELRVATLTPDATGGLLIQIPAMVNETKALENELWSQLDPLLSTQQQSVARMYLSLESTTPLLGVGLRARKIELARVGEWFRWREESDGQEVRSGQGPELPPEFRRFWPATPVDLPIELPEADPARDAPPDPRRQ